LSVRKLTEHAGVNLGMFHYHFRNKDNFVRTLLQRTYESMFAALSLTVEPQRAPLDNLRAALTVLARFGRQHRRLLLRIAVDALGGERLAADFLRNNLPRHLAVLRRLLEQAQRQGLLQPLPLPQLVAFLAGAVGAPVLLGTALELHAGAETAALIERHVLSDAAIAQRIELALRALSTPEGSS
jgi:AcrR family transcriptional regulator